MSESTRRQGASDPGSGAADRPAAPRVGVAALVDDLLRDRGDEQLARRAAQLRHDLRVPHGLLLLAGGAAAVAAAARAATVRVHRAVPVEVLDGGPPHVALVVPVPAPSLWTHALDVVAHDAWVHGVLVLVRPPVSGLRALRAAYHRALADAALAVPLRLPGPLVQPEELVVPRMLAFLDAADQRSLLAPLEPLLSLPALHRDAYLTTIDLLRRNGGDLVATAAQLHLHVNSVRRRIDRIEELTHHRLDNPAHRLLLDLGVILVALRGTLSPPPPEGDDFELAVMDAPELHVCERPLALAA